MVAAGQPHMSDTSICLQILHYAEFFEHIQWKYSLNYTLQVRFAIIITSFLHWSGSQISEGYRPHI